jgi:hypothetical protein
VFYCHQKQQCDENTGRDTKRSEALLLIYCSLLAVSRRQYYRRPLQYRIADHQRATLGRRGDIACRAGGGDGGGESLLWSFDVEETFDPELTSHHLRAVFVVRSEDSRSSLQPATVVRMTIFTSRRGRAMLQHVLKPLFVMIIFGGRYMGLAELC